MLLQSWAAEGGCAGLGDLPGSLGSCQPDLPSVSSFVFCLVVCLSEVETCFSVFQVLGFLLSLLMLVLAGSRRWLGLSRGQAASREATLVRGSDLRSLLLLEFAEILVGTIIS